MWMLVMHIELKLMKYVQKFVANWIKGNNKAHAHFLILLYITEDTVPSYKNDKKG